MKSLMLDPLVIAVLAAGGVGTAAVMWLTLGLDFHVATSPAWQLAPYFLAQAIMLAAVALAGRSRGFSWMGRWRWALPSLVFVFLVLLLAESRLVQGPFESFRDPRYYPLVLRASALAVSGIAAAGILTGSLYVVGLLACRNGWSGVLAFAPVSRVMTAELRSAYNPPESVPGEEGSGGWDRH